MFDEILGKPRVTILVGHSTSVQLNLILLSVPLMNNAEDFLDSNSSTHAFTSMLPLYRYEFHKIERNALVECTD